MDSISILFSVTSSIVPSIIISFYFTAFQSVITDYKDFYRCKYILDEIKGVLENAINFDKWEKKDSYLWPKGYTQDICLQALNISFRENNIKIIDEASIFVEKSEKRLSDLAREISNFALKMGTYQDVNDIDEKELKHLNDEAGILISKYNAYKYDIWKIVVAKVLKSRLALSILVLYIVVIITA